MMFLVVLCDISMIRNTFYKCAHTGLNYHINKLQLLRDPLKKGNALPVTTMTSSDLKADTYWMNCRPFWISCQRILLSWHGPDMFARFSIHSSVSTWNHDMTLYLKKKQTPQTKTLLVWSLSNWFTDMTCPVWVLLKVWHQLYPQCLELPHLVMTTHV